MYFDEEDEGLFNHEIYHVLHSDLLLHSKPFGRTVPTHTEDGIPIRKLYVSNLPSQTTRPELFAVFAQYGFIKSCWLKMEDKTPNRISSPTYAFVTFSNPSDAHKALQAPSHEKILRGRNLRISPADSWHQPLEDGNGQVHWSNSRRDVNRGETVDSSNAVETVEREESNEEATETDDPEDDSDRPYNILDILNRDCITHILEYVSIRDLIRSERVSKQWQSMIQEYLQSIRLFKTSSWEHIPITLTTAVLRRVLKRLGSSLLRLHIDHHWSALNDRTAHTVGKFCPHLEELKIIGMHTKNWNPLHYGCRRLRSLSFVSCSKLTDSSLVHLVRSDSCIESLTVADNTHVTGLFLTSANPLNLTSLAFYNCYSLQGSVLSSGLVTLPNLTTLKLDVCPTAIWKILPFILNKLPKLVELSLSEYTSSDVFLPNINNDAFCLALSGLSELRILNLSRNIYINNVVLKTVAKSCPKLESLNISSCGSRRMNCCTNFFEGKQSLNSVITDEGVTSICTSCTSLSCLDISYLPDISDKGVLAAAALPCLSALTSHGNPALSDVPFEAVLASCRGLRELDLCGCNNITGGVICAASEAVLRAPRPLILRLASTTAASICRQAMEHEHQKLLTVNLDEDRSNPQLHPDFVDHLYEPNSDDSLEDVLYDHEDYNFFDDDEPFFDDDFDDYDDIPLHEAMQNVILL